LLWDQWHLSQDDIRELIRFCPNLEQLGIGVNNEDSLRAINLLLPFLPKLHALRLLLGNQVETECNNIDHHHEMKRSFAKLHSNLRYMGVGKRIFKLGNYYETITADGTVEPMMDVTEQKLEDVLHVDIWGMDRLDISLDPVAPFSP
jgi:hypothetical protein